MLLNGMGCYFPGRGVRMGYYSPGRGISKRDGVLLSWMGY